MRNSAHTDNPPPFIEEGDDNKITTCEPILTTVAKVNLPPIQSSSSPRLGPNNSNTCKRQGVFLHCTIHRQWSIESCIRGETYQNKTKLA